MTTTGEWEVGRELYGAAGADLSALVAGPEDGDVVVLVHGLLASAELWRPVMQPLAAAGHRVIAIDLPGHGHTVMPPHADHSPGGLAELVANWLRVTPGGPVWLVGQGLGAGVAQVIATRYPQAVAHLTLLAAMVGDAPALPMLGRLQRRASSSLPIQPVRATQVTGWVAEAVACDSPSGDVVDRVFSGSLRDHDARRALRRVLAQWDPTDVVAAGAQLGRLAMPLDLVWGDQDPWTPAATTGQELVELASDVQMATIPGGHFLSLEQPELLVAAMLRLHAMDRPDEGAASVADSA